MQNFIVCVQMCVFRGFMAPNRLESSGKKCGSVCAHKVLFFGVDISIQEYRNNWTAYSSYAVTE